NSENDIMLYSTKLSIKDSTKVRLVYQNKPGADISLGVDYDNDYSNDNMTYYQLTDSEEDWEVKEVDIGDDAGKTAYGLSLRVENQGEVEDYAINLGQVSVYDEESPELAVKEATVEEKMLKAADNAEARLSWTPEEDALHYEVYQENAQEEKKLLGVTT